jgi:Ca2+-binding EF-hand superfamily protein
MRIYLLCPLCFALLLFAGRGVSAAESKPSGADDAAALFDRLDANHDGQLIADEIPAEKKGLFERLLRLTGKPADGKLSRSEFIAQLKSATKDHPSAPASTGAGAADKPSAAAPAVNGFVPDPEKIFDRLDSKHTGKITAEDIPEGRPLLKRIFAEASKSDGGSLTKDEFVKAFKALLAKRAGGNPGIGAIKPAADSKPGAGSSGKPGADAGAKPLGGPRDGEPFVRRLLSMSKRPDGKLTKDDLPERLRDRFDKIDANHDGLIDETELRDWIAQVKRRLEAAQSK